MMKITHVCFDDIFFDLLEKPESTVLAQEGDQPREAESWKRSRHQALTNVQSHLAHSPGDGSSGTPFY